MGRLSAAVRAASKAFCEVALPPVVNSTSADDTWRQLAQWLGVDPDAEDKGEVTYHACLKVLAESVAKVPMQIRIHDERGTVVADKHRYSNMLTLRANRNQSIVEFLAAVEMSRNHYGNAVICVRPQLGRKSEMFLLPWPRVTLIVDDARSIMDQHVWYQYSSPDGMRYYKSEDIIHLRSADTKNHGLEGVPVLERLASTLEGARDAQSLMNKLWKSGISQKVAVQYTSDLAADKRDAMLAKINDYMTGEMRDKATGNLIPMPAGMSLQPLTQSLVNAQFCELRQLSALQIASAFGIKPYQINAESKTSQGSESQQKRIAFHVDTMLFIFKMYEAELSYKLLTRDEVAAGYAVDFITDEVLRVDDETLCNIMTSYADKACMMVNEVRARLGLPAVPGGDRLIYNAGGTPVPLDSPRIDGEGGDNT